MEISISKNEFLDVKDEDDLDLEDNSWSLVFTCMFCSRCIWLYFVHDVVAHP